MIVDMCTENAVDDLKGADWNFLSEGADLTPMVNPDDRFEVISSYIIYLKDSIIRIKHVRVFPYSKHWLYKAVRCALHRKQHAFLHGNDEENVEAKKRPN